jgi:hypothetical protein
MEMTISPTNGEEESSTWRKSKKNCCSLSRRKEKRYGLSGLDKKKRKEIT